MNKLRIRGVDKWGNGAFGSSRGERIHNGADVVCASGDLVRSATPGTVTKIGYPYNPTDPRKGHYRYVEVTLDGNRFRYFYVLPCVDVGQPINAGDCVGQALTLGPVYPGITPHYHFEIIDPHGEYIDPVAMFPDLFEDSTQ